MLNFIKTTDNTDLIGLTIVALIILPGLLTVVINLFNNPHISFGGF